MRHSSLTTAGSLKGWRPTATSSIRAGRRGSLSSQRPCSTQGFGLNLRQWGLRDVRPCSAVNDPVNSVLADAEVPSDGPLRLSFGALRPDAPHLIVRKFGLVVSRPSPCDLAKQRTVRLPLRLSIPLHLIANIAVVVVCAKVRRVTARRIVAFVADEKPARDRAMRQLPRDAVSTVLTATNGDYPVAATSMGRACPNPARTEFGAARRDRAVSIDPLPDIRHGILSHSSVEPPYSRFRGQGRLSIPVLLCPVRHSTTGGSRG